MLATEHLQSGSCAPTGRVVQFVPHTSDDQITLKMFINNSSARPLQDFDGKFSCIHWHLQNDTTSYAEAQQACSMYKDPAGLATAIIFGLTGVLIIVPNVVVLCGILGTRQLHKPLYFYLANLAFSDLLAGIGLVCHTTGEVSGVQGTRILATFMIFTQVMSASALSLLSVNSYVAVRHPIYFHTHADTAKRDAGLAIASSWIVLPLLVFSPRMGRNGTCLDMTTRNVCSMVFFGLTGTVFLLLVIIILFTNISIVIALKQRQRRLCQAGLREYNSTDQNGVRQVQNPTAEEETERIFKKSVHKARTVMIHVVVAFIFWLLPLVTFTICIRQNVCPIPPHGLPVVFSLNSVISPIASLIRTPELRKRLRQIITGIPRVLVTLARGNRVNPHEEQTASDGNLYGAPGSGSGQHASDK